MTRIAKHALTTVAAFGLVVAASASGAPDASAEISFKGKRINVIIGSSPGGGTDGTTRLVGRYLERYLPGEPQMVYRNMPAGHGVKANNYFYNQAKTDGTFWFGGSSSYVDAGNLRKKVVEYDPTKYVYIGGIDRGGSIVVARLDTRANLTGSGKPVVAGVIDGSRTWAQMLVWGSEFLNWNIKYVVGYPGSASLVLAARKGEIDMFGTSNAKLLESVLKTGDFYEMAQIGQFSEGKYKARSSFKDAPVFPDLMVGKTSGIAEKAFDYWSKANQIDKWYALPPKTPADVVKTYRAAWDKVMQDAEFIKHGKNQFSVDFSPQTGEDIGAAIRASAFPDDAVLDYMRQLRVKHGLPATQLSDEEMKRLAKKFETGGIEVKKVKLDAVKRGGRWLHFKNEGAEHKTKVSSSRTKVTIGGKETKRKNLKAGMVCDISYASNGGEAKTVECSKPGA